VNAASAADESAAASSGPGVVAAEAGVALPAAAMVATAVAGVATAAVAVTSAGSDTAPAAPAPVEAAPARPAQAPTPAPAPLPAPAAPAPVAAKPVVIEPYALPTDALASLASTAGLQWVQSDTDKVRAVQAAMAAEPAPIHVPREPRRHVLVDEGPLVLVETRKDLSQIQLPFEQQPSPSSSNASH